ncbi:hypothetical protein F4604DRAFT_1540416, partial [Suillus subluteus]
YQINVAENFRPDQLIFVDESACNRITTRHQMTWSPLGSRAPPKVVENVEYRYFILPARSLDGILHLDVRETLHTSVDFNQFIYALLDNM